MSKAILLMDMPKSCVLCPMLFAGRYCKGKKPPNIAIDSYFDKTKPSWCPLKELPQKVTSWKGKSTNYQQGHREGYNAAIDEILGKDV